VVEVNSEPDIAEPVADGTSGQLMADARHAMTAGEISRAIQIYTKVLQQPPNAEQQAAQEYLALARERNGQVAHAKAEYERYLVACSPRANPVPGNFGRSCRSITAGMSINSTIRTK
jgi:Tfp pilus assembly protein PilF